MGRLPGPRGDKAPAARLGPILAVVLLAEVMDVLDTTTVNVIGPSVERSLGGGIATVQWLASGYTLAFAALLVPAARLGDHWGRRRVFLLGAAGFTLASLLCAAAQGPAWLAAARLLQGCCAALLLPQGLGLLKDGLPPDDLPKALAFYAPVLSAAAVAGPLVAGALVQWNLCGLSWRLTFAINLVLGLGAAGGGMLLLPRDGPARPGRLGMAGAALLALGTAAILYPLIAAGGLGGPLRLALAAGGVGALVLFVRRERRGGDTLLAPGLLKDPAFTAAAALTLLYFAAAAGVLLVVSLYAQERLGYSALGAGLTLAPAALGNVLGAIASLRAQRRLAARRVLRAQIGVAAAGLLLMALAGLGSWPLAGPVLALPVAVVGIGLGGIVGPLYTATLAGVGADETGSASGGLGAAQQLGASLGASALAAAFAALGTSRATNGLVAAAVPGLVLLAACALLAGRVGRAREVHG